MSAAPCGHDKCEDWWPVLDQLEPGPWALDAYGNAAGAGMGLRAAGYTGVVGIDVVRRACGYPAGPLVKANALCVLADVEFVRRFLFAHTSPPCQTHTRCKHLRDAQGKSTSILDLVDDTRQLLDAAGVPWCIENVEGAPVRPDLVLCGSMFDDLRVVDETGTRWLKRHRIFEFGAGAVVPLPPRPCCTCQAGCSAPGCGHRAAGVRALGVYASKADNIPAGGQTCRTVEQARELMAMPWASWKALTEALPPPYLEHIGRAQLTGDGVPAAPAAGTDELEELALW